MFRIDKSAIDYIDANLSRLAVGDPSRGRPATALPGPEEPTDTPHAAQSPEELLEEAREQARQMMALAHEKAAELMRQAKADGYKEGTARAKQEHEQHTLQLTTEMQGIKQAMQQAMSNMQAQMEQSIGALALAIAKKIVNESLENHDIVFREMIQTAIQRIRPTHAFTLRVSSETYRRYFDEGGQWIEQQTHCPPLNVTVDDSLEPGSYQLEVQGETIEAGVSAQIQKLSESLGCGEQHAFEL